MFSFINRYNSIFLFSDNSIQLYRESPLVVTVEDLTNTIKMQWDYKEGRKDFYFIRLTLSTSHQGQTQPFILTSLKLYRTKQYPTFCIYEGFAISASPEISSAIKLPLNEQQVKIVSIHDVEGGCDSLTIEYQNGNKLLLSIGTENDISGLEDYIDIDLGCPVYMIEDLTSGSLQKDHVFTVCPIEGEEDSFNRYNAFLNYIIFSNYKYKSYASSPSTLTSKLYFTFNNEEERKFFRNMTRSVFKKYFDNRELRERYFPLKYARNDWKHPIVFSSYKDGFAEGYDDGAFDAIKYGYKKSDDSSNTMLKNKSDLFKKGYNNGFRRGFNEFFEEEKYDEDESTGWSDKDLRDAYLSAMEDDLSNEWNID